MKSFRAICSAAIISGLELLACGALAADRNYENDNGGDVDNIIVTASRTPVAAPQTGMSISVIDREQIELRQARYVTDVLRAVPGFSVSHTGGPGAQTQVRVRGAEANHVLVLIDGMRANDPASGDEFRWEFLSTNNVERIEIVRGPQSALWGSDAVAAVVNVITRHGDNAGRIDAFAEGGSHDTVNAGLSGATSGDNWSLAFGVEQLDSDGTNISRVGGERDGADLLTTSISARFQATKRWTFDVGARRVDGRSDVDPIDFFTTGLPTDGDLVNDGVRHYLHAGTVLRAQNGWLTQRLTASFFDSRNANLVDGVWSASTASDRARFVYQADIAFSENVVAVALEHERTEFQQRGVVNFGDPNQDQAMDVSSVVVDFQGKPSAATTLLASARLDDNSEFEDVLTGRLSLSWQASETLRLRASAGMGQKAPTFIERYGFFPGQFSGNAALEPEESTSYEIGIEKLLAGNDLAVGLTVFSQDLDNEINGFAFDPDTFLFTAENLAGSSSRDGVEAEIRYRPSDVVDVHASYTYTDASQPDSGSGTLELRRPKHSASVGGSLRFLDDRGTVSLNADYGGTRFDRFFPPFPLAPEFVALKSYWQVDVAVGLDVTPTLNLFVRATNLLDDEYEQVFGFRTAPRGVFAGVRVSLGR